MSQQEWTEAEMEAHSLEEKGLIDTYLSETGAEQVYVHSLQVGAEMEFSSWLHRMEPSELFELVLDSAPLRVAVLFQHEIMPPEEEAFIAALQDFFDESARFYEWLATQPGFDSRADVAGQVRAFETATLLEKTLDRWQGIRAYLAGENEEEAAAPTVPRLSAEEKKARKKKTKAQKAARKKARR